MEFIYIRKMFNGFFGISDEGTKFLYTFIFLPSSLHFF